MIKTFLKKITGIDKLEKAKADAQIAMIEAQAQAKEAEEAEKLAKMTPKERATAKGEPWVSVLETHVNKENIRNGFFELDWNEQFIVQLKQAGYGFDGDPDEEIVDRWFRDLARNMLAESGIAEPERHNAGFINVTKLANGKAQIE